MPASFRTALFAAVITFILTFPLLGLQLEREGITLVVRNADAETWTLIGLGVLAVFLFQLFKPQITAFRVRVLDISGSHGRFNFDDGMKARIEKVALALLLGLAVIWPFISDRGNIDLATLVLIYVMLGLGLNIVVGLAGLLDLGYVAFYAVGAYSYALLSEYMGISFWLALPIGGLLAALFGFLLGFPVLRLRGDYLAIVTLGFGEIIREMLNIHTDLTGGPNGIGQIPRPTLPAFQLNPEPGFVQLEFGRRASEGHQTFHEFFGLEYNSETKVMFLYLIALVLVLITLFVIRRLTKMPVGRAWEALREDEIASRSLGLNKTGIKLSAFTIGASFAGFAGCFFAARQGFISPESFTFIESAIILAIVVLGGMGSQIGVICAAIVMIVLPEIAREFAEYRMLMFGALMVLMMIWRPEGLLPVKRSHITIKAA